jgi:hypothetical protein
MITKKNNNSSNVREHRVFVEARDYLTDGHRVTKKRSLKM